MPAFGRDGILEPTHIADAVSHVRVISRQEKPSVSSARGAALFEVNCAVCHGPEGDGGREVGAPKLRSEEHTSELQSLMRISYAVFCLKQKKNKKAQLNATLH